MPSASTPSTSTVSSSMITFLRLSTTPQVVSLVAHEASLKKVVGRLAWANELGKPSEAMSAALKDGKHGPPAQTSLSPSPLSFRIWFVQTPMWLLVKTVTRILQRLRLPPLPLPEPAFEALRESALQSRGAEVRALKEPVPVPMEAFWNMRAKNRSKRSCSGKWR